MTEEQIELARRLVAHPRWMAKIGEALSAGRDSYGMRWADTSPSTALDLTDAATGGVLLEMLRAEFCDGNSTITIEVEDDNTQMLLGRRNRRSWSVSAAFPPEACAHALLALWGDE